VLFGTTAIVIVIKVEKPYLKAFFLTCIAALFANFYLATTLYKIVATYNGQIKAAEYLNQDTSDHHVYSLKFENNIFQFYSNRPIDLIPLESFKEFKPLSHPIFFANQKSLNFLINQHADFKVIKAFQNYPQEILFPAFIDKATRSRLLDSVYLITK
jgi:hypothetical protein